MSKISLDTYRDIVENIAEGIRVLDENGMVIYANDALCSMLGYDKAEIIGKSVYDLYPPEERHIVTKHLEDRKSGKAARYEIRYVRKTGEKLFAGVSAMPILDENGKYHGTYTLVRDITERKRLEQQILEEKNFLNDLIGLCPDSIIGVNRKGIIIIFNQAAELLTGYSANEVIGQMHILAIYNSEELAKDIKKKIYCSDFGGVGKLDGYEVEVLNRSGKKFRSAYLPR
ncbi:MAG: PAS domain S-box protein [Desulfobacteraceae bacterium]|nr:PAS domain S-box protein [Desulfobacteraceae bacterium]